MSDREVYFAVMLVSVQVVQSYGIIKYWGIHTTATSATVHNVFAALLNGSLDGSRATCTKIPANLSDYPCQVFVAKGVCTVYAKT